MVSSKEILEIESSFCLLIPEQLSLLKVFLFLDINYIGFSATVMPINVFFLPISQFGRYFSIWLFEVVSRTILVLTGHQEGGEDIPQLVLTGPGRRKMVRWSEQSQG